MKLTKQNIINLLVGKTHTLDLAQGGQGYIFYETDTQAYMQLPTAPAPMRGTWQAVDEGYHCDWENGPSIDWHLKMDGDAVLYITPEGVTAGTVTTSNAGDTTGLKAHFE